MRFGHRPRVADLFCGSGQIPFEAARLGCDVYASDLNPVACMLTWGAFHIVGSSPKEREELEARTRIALVENVQAEIDRPRRRGRRSTAGRLGPSCTASKSVAHKPAGGCRYSLAE